MTRSAKELVRIWFEQVWNQSNRGVIADMLTPETVFHDAGTTSLGIVGFESFYDRLQASLSDVHVDVEDILVEEDKVCVRWTSSAKHTGDGLGISPTNAAVRITGMSLIRIADGKFVEAWQNWDQAGLMAQIQEHASLPASVKGLA